MNMVSRQYTPELELERIKNKLLDAFVKIHLHKKDKTCHLEVVEMNDKAKKKLHVTDFADLDFLETICKHLSNDIDWKEAFHKVCQNQSEACFEVNNSESNRSFHIRITSLDEDTCLMNIQDSTLLRKSRKELSQTKQLFEEFADNIPEIICDVNANGYIYFANQKALDTFGYNQEDIENGLSIMGFFQEKDHKVIQHNFNQILKGKKLPSHEYRLSELGNSIHIMLSTTPILQGDAVSGVRAVMADITKKDEIQKSLHVSDQNFRNLFDSLSSFVFILNTKGKILHTNKTAQNRLAYTEAEFQNLYIHDLHETSSKCGGKGIMHNVSKTKVKKCTVPLLDKFGNQIAVDTNIILGEWNNQTVLFVNSKDLTETEASQKKFASAFKTNPSLMALTTIDGYILDINDSFLKTTGYKKQEIIHRGIRELKLVDNTSILDTIRIQLSQNGKIKNLETSIRDKVGNSRKCLFSAEIIQQANNRYVLVVLNDISEQHNLNQKLNMAMKTAKLSWYEFDIETGHVTSGSNRAEMLGYDPREFYDKHYEVWTNLIHPEDQDQAGQPVIDCIEGKADFYQIDYRMKKENGDYSWFYDRGIVMEHTKNGKPKLISGVVVDITDRKESEDRYKRLIEAANDVILITQNGVMKYVNNQVKGFFGYNKEDIIDQKFLDFISPEEQVKVIDYHKRRMEGETLSPIYETKILSQDGIEVPVELNNSFFVYNNEPAILTFVRDLSDRKATEQQLKKSLKDFKLATENVSSIIWKTDINDKNEFHNTFISSVGDKLLAYEGDSLNDDLNKFFKHIHPEDFEESMNALNYGIANPGIKIEFEYRVIKANGEIAWFITQGSSEIDEEGKHSLFGVTMDISERKEAEMQIYQQREFLYRLIDNIPSMIAVKDQDGVFTNVNKHFADFYNLKPEDIIGKTDYDLLPADIAESLDKANNKTLKDGKTIKYNTTEIQNNETRYFDVTKVPLKSNEDIYNQLLIISNDTTHQSLTRKEIQKKSQELLMLLENIDVQIWYMKDPETYGLINKAHAEFIGYSKEEVEHQSIHQLFTDRFNNSYISTNKECFTNKEVIHFDEWNKDSKGEPRLLRITKNPMINEYGEVDFIICLARDITEEKEAEESLSSALQFNQALIHNSPLGITVYQTDGQCIMANQAAADTVGALEPDLLIKQNIYEIESWQKTGLDMLFDKLKSSTGKAHDVVRMVTTFGKELWLECNFLTIDYQGIKHIMLMMEDISDKKQQEIIISENLERQKTLSSISLQLSELKDFNHNINECIRIIGEFMGVSRVYIFNDSDDGETCSNTFEWVNQNISSHIDKLQNVPYRIIPSWKELINNHGYIYSNDIKNLPADIIAILEPQEIKSLIVYPLFLFGQYKGFIGIDENTRKREWQKDDFEFINTISHIIANTYERKIIGDNLKDSEEMFKKITGSAQDGIILINSKGKVEYWNPSAEKVFGYKRLDIIHKDLHNLLTEPNDNEAYLSHKELFANTGKGNAIGKNLVLKAKHKTGRIIDIELSLSSLKIKGEWHALGLVRDITERKKNEEQLKTLSKAVENASASVVITDIDGNIEYVNKKFETSTGYTFNEVFGRNPNILSSGQHSKEYYTELWDTISQGREWKGEFHNKRKDGSTYFENALISSVNDKEGNILHYIGIKEDITNEKHAQAELLEAKKNAEMANKAKSEFLANMSHEIRTPMNAVIGFSDILSQKLTDKEHISYLDSIQASSKTLLNLINDILDLSKIEAGQMVVQPEQTNLKSIIEDIAQIFSLKVHQKNLNYEVDIDPNIPERVFIDELRLRQILLNLIGNAVKFTEQGYVKIIAELSSYNADDSVNIKITIEDSGIGIKATSQQEIFEAFRQQEDHNTRKYGGTGLGLSITKRLVEILGGRIDMKSQLGVGSSFYVSFDNLEIPQQIFETEVPVNVPDSNIEFNDELILIVDDVPSNRFLLNSYLSNHKLRTIEAENGAEAIEMCEREMPDIVLMDLRMPVMNGVDATKGIKRNEKTASIPVVAVTASSMNFDDQDIQDSQFDGFLDKPVSQEEIIGELIKHLKPGTSNGSTKQVITNGHSPAFNFDLNDNEIELVQEYISKEIHTVESSGNMNEITNFAENIQIIGMNHKSDRMIDYSNELKTASQNFDIEKIQELFELLKKYC